jgi:hypothetical protein
MTEKKRLYPAWMQRVGARLDPELLADARRVMIIVMAFGCYGWILNADNRWMVLAVFAGAVFVWFFVRSLERARDQEQEVVEGKDS